MADDSESDKNDDDEEDEDEDGEEEGDEKEIKEDENFGRPKGKFRDYEIYKGESDYNEKGTYMDHEGTKIYASGPKTLVGILVLGDLHGWSQGRMKEIVDYIGYCVHGRAMIPRLLDEPCFGEGTENDGLPPEFDQIEGKQELKTWIMKYSWENWRVKIQALLVKMRKDGVKRIAGVGFGFGAWVLAHASAMIGEYIGSVFVYPEIERFELDQGRDIDHLIKKIRGSALLMPYGVKMQKPYGAQRTYYPGGEVFELLKQRENKEVECMPFEEMIPGWTLIGDPAQVGVKPATLRCVQQTTTRLKKILWPPPAGANSATLRTAARDNDSAKVEELISFGVPFDGTEGGDLVGLTGMHYAAKEGNPGPMKVLLRANADVNETGGLCSETALHVAAYEGSAKCCKVLLEWKCDLDKMDRAGQRPLHWAACMGQCSTIKVLVEGMADMEVRDTAGQAPLHLAAYFGQKPAVLLLLSMKADCDPLDLRFKTPQKRAEECEFQVIFDIFETEREQRQEAFEKAEKEREDREREEEAARDKQRALEEAAAASPAAEVEL
eukprot:TRINITY_DN38105_c0_g1_i1.p1 TRINITY_DN38105_c0_g1~~TRINITY_DN38105_c0_g1_i1.p1  ORF type:complete len:552 (-),score=138.32 TRINITY_DN38105_c0_g1_i1:69-1724(-)